MSRLGYHTLHDRDGLALLMTSWRRGDHPERARVEAPASAIEFMRRGSYVRQAGRREELVDPTTVAFFRAGEGFTVTHPLGDSNGGTTLRVAPDRLAEAGIDGPIGPSSRTLVASPASLHLAQQCLVNALLQDAAGGVPPLDPLAAEERILALLHAVLEGCGALPAPPSPPASQRRAVRAAQEFLNARFHEAIALADVAAAAGVSRWHLCRTFAAVTGRSVHAYRVALRLRCALSRLAEGCNDLTALALSCGFASHAHLTDSFRAAFGAAPREVRRELRHPRAAAPMTARHSTPPRRRAIVMPIQCSDPATTKPTNHA